MPFFSVLNWRPPCGAVSSIGRNQGSGNQEVEAGLGYCHSEGPTVEFCAAFPCNSALNNCSFWSPKRTDSCQGHHKRPSDLYGKATDRTLGNFCVQGATGKRSCRAGRPDGPWSSGGGLLSHKGSEEECV